MGAAVGQPASNISGVDDRMEILRPICATRRQKAHLALGDRPVTTPDSGGTVRERTIRLLGSHCQ